MMLAQSIDALPEGFWKQFSIAVIALIVLVCVVIGAWAAWVSIQSAKASKSIAIADQPVEFRKAAKRYNHELSESRHGETTRRLDGHDAEIEQLWTTMRNEDAAIRRENGAKFDAILLSLGEIKGELKKTK